MGHGFMGLMGLMGSSRNRFVCPDGLIRSPPLLVSLSDNGSTSIVDGSKVAVVAVRRWHGDVEAGLVSYLSYS